ncbi:1965_t:CDS:2, partial [Racocetra persica]
MSRISNLRKRNRSLREDSPEDELDRAIQSSDADVLINKSFTLYRCTPLYKFELSKLCQYAKEIQKFIEGQMNGILPFDSSEEFENINMLKEGRVTDVVISRINVPEWNALNDLPIGIEIQFRPKRSSTEQKFHIILFPSRHGNDTNTDLSFSHYPLMITKAPQRITTIFIEWIQRQFDCRICRCHLQSSNLKSIVEEWAKFILCEPFNTYNTNHTDLPSSPSASRQIELTYSIPNIAEIKNITLRISFEDTNRLYNRKIIERQTQNGAE